MGKVLASIILPCKNEGGHIRNTVYSILNAPGNVAYEVIVVNDGSTDGCCDWLVNSPHPKVRLLTTSGLGAALARNLGAAQAAGDYLVFCDAHTFVGGHWLDNLLPPLQKGTVQGICPGIAPVEDPNNVGWGQTIKDDFGVLWLGPVQALTEVPVLPGGCLALTAEAFRAVGGFDQGSRIWGHEDVELSIHLWLAGYTLAVHPRVKVLHVFRPTHPYQVTMDDWYYNLLRIGARHFNSARMAKLIGMANQSTNFDRLMAEVICSDVWLDRLKFLETRKYDDDWLMSRFGIGF